MSATLGGNASPPQLIPDADVLFTVPDSPSAQTFELGLVLGGTVSVGAYTAGALDLLVQALDSFHAQENSAPHQVKLMLATGSSGGAVCAALLGISLTHQFPAVVDNQAALNSNGTGPAENKFWDVWVNRLELGPMLDTSDLDTANNENQIQDPRPTPDDPIPPTQYVAALLNSGPIDKAVTEIARYARSGGTTSRTWAASPFRVATTVCNLRGMPYCIQDIPTYGRYTGAAYVEHDDYAWFAVPNTPPGSAEPAIAYRPDHFQLSATPQNGISWDYEVIGDYARVSGAMPVGLPARALSRPAEHYLYRPYAAPGDDGKPQLVFPTPDWKELDDVLQDGVYNFVGVDGGTLNNDPVKIAHDALAGVGQSNLRSPDQAVRAMLMIDPLVDEPSKLQPVGRSLVSALKALLATFVGGARYLTADLDLFRDDHVFSRFQLVPNRLRMDNSPFPSDLAPVDSNNQPPVGADALAGTDLEAAGGWCAREFRVHDFLLGRQNMARFLRRELILRADNPLFDQWPSTLVNDYCMDAAGNRVPAVDSTTRRNTYYLPIIPMAADDFGVVEPEWPKGAVQPDAWHNPIEQRLEKVLNVLRADNLPGFADWLIALVMLGGVAATIADDIIQAFKTSLQRRNLL